MKRFALLLPLLFCGCTAIPGRPLQDRCHVYIEGEDLCVQRGGAVVRQWSDKHPWEDGRERAYDIYIAASETERIKR